MLSFEDFEEGLTRAKRNPHDLSKFKRYRLNIWKTDAESYLPLADWKSLPSYAPESTEGEDCWSGLDLANTTDMAALVHVFPYSTEIVNAEGELEERTGLDILPRIWMPSERIDYFESIGVNVTKWRDDGHLTVIDGRIIDHSLILAQIFEDAERFNIRSLAFDRWGSSQVAKKLEEEGLEVVPFGQGYASMSAPTKMLKEMILLGLLRHNQNAVLNWMIGNVTISTDPTEAIKPIKKTKGSGAKKKIDAVIALIMAGAIALNPSDEPTLESGIL